MKTVKRNAVLLAGAYMALLLCSHLIRHMELDEIVCRERTAEDHWPLLHGFSPDNGYTVCEPRAWYLP